MQDHDTIFFLSLYLEHFKKNYVVLGESQNLLNGNLATHWEFSLCVHFLTISARSDAIMSCTMINSMSILSFLAPLLSSETEIIASVHLAIWIKSISSQKTNTSIFWMAKSQSRLCIKFSKCETILIFPYFSYMSDWAKTFQTDHCISNLSESPNTKTSKSFQKENLPNW